MLKTTVKGLLAHKLRLASTFVAVMLGVAFVAGTYVLGDTLTHTFDKLFGEVTAGIDVSVRSRSAFQSSGDNGNTSSATDREPMPASVLASVRQVDGVRVAEGSVGGYAQLVDKKGKAIAPQAPTIGTNYTEDEQLSPLTIRSGRSPRRDGEMVIDAGTARKYHFRVGDRVKVLLRGPASTFTVVGIVGFGARDNLAGATLAAFDTTTAQRIFNRVGTFDNISVAADKGVSRVELRNRINNVLPASYQAVTGQKVADESSSAVKAGLSGFTTFILVFAFIALFVGSFIIFNTFSIIVAQRTRELAMMRALGASRRQVMLSVLAEAFVVSLVASVTGIGLGLLVAKGLTALIKAIGIDLPTSGLVFLPRTVIVSLLVGVLVTCAASLAPARRAGRVPPVAAMRDTIIEPPHSLRRRLITGGLVTVTGNALLFLGLFGNSGNGLPLVGLGAMLAFIGVAMLSPIVARPVTQVIGAPVRRFFGLPGRLAQENAMRNPRRTASTAAALMIGLGLVGAVTVMAASLKASASALVNKSLAADYVLQAKNFSGFSPEVGKRLDGQPGIAAASGFRGGQFRYKTSKKDVEGVDPRGVGKVIRVVMKRGRLADLGPGTMMVEDTELDKNDWKVGQTIPVEFARTGRQQLRIAGTYDSNQFLGKYIISSDTFEANFSDPLDFVVAVRLADGVSLTQGKTVIKGVLDEFPNVEAKDQSQYKKEISDQVNKFLGLVYALLALAVIIALVGIMNTMALSVFERTRELGLVRAVGMSRRQLRRMVRWESVVVSIFGALLGLLIGVAFGRALVYALKDEGIDVFRLPVVSLLVFVVVAGLAGMLAAILPARRASKLDVLKAISTD